MPRKFFIVSPSFSLLLETVSEFCYYYYANLRQLLNFMSPLISENCRFFDDFRRNRIQLTPLNSFNIRSKFWGQFPTLLLTTLRCKVFFRSYDTKYLFLKGGSHISRSKTAADLELI